MVYKSLNRFGSLQLPSPGNNNKQSTHALIGIVVTMNDVMTESKYGPQATVLTCPRQKSIPLSSHEVSLRAGTFSTTPTH